MNARINECVLHDFPLGLKINDLEGPPCAPTVSQNIALGCCLHCSLCIHNWLVDMALSHLDAAKEPTLDVDHIGDPFGNPASSQFGIVPNLSSPASPGPIASADSPGTGPMQSQALRGPLKGTAEELHLRNASRASPSSLPPPEGADDEDILVELAKQPVDQRLLALVCVQHTTQENTRELLGTTRDDSKEMQFAFKS